MGGLTGLKRLLIGASATFVLMASSVAQASPVFSLTGATALAGSNVGIKVAGDVNFFFGADFTVGFDNAVLSYVGITPANFSSTANLLVSGQVTLAVTPLAPGAGLGAGPAFDYFEIIFSILPGGSGSSVVQLLSGSNLYFDGTPDTFDVSGLSATVGIASNAVPVGSTAVLVLAGLALLAQSRRRVGRLSPVAAA